MKLSWLALSIFLFTACNGKTSPEYSFMGEVKQTQFPEGYVGCEWVTHNVKVNPPLTGKLVFDTPNCYVDQQFRPKYGHTREFRLDRNNFLRVTVSPLDPKFKNRRTTKTSPLAIYSLDGSKPETFLTQFLKKDAPEGCALEQNTSGRWQIGMTKLALEANGYSFPYFNQACPDGIWDSEYKSEPCWSEHHFPIEHFGGESCVKLIEKNTFFNAFRVNGDFVFAYRQDEIESHPDNIRALAPYSIRYRP